MNTTPSIMTVLDVLRLAAQNLPGTTVQVDNKVLQTQDGGTVYTINEMEHEAVKVPARLHIIVDNIGMYPVRKGSSLDEQINSCTPITPATARH